MNCNRNTPPGGERHQLQSHHSDFLLRSKSLALHTGRSRSITSDPGEVEDGVEWVPEKFSSNTGPNQRPDDQEEPQRDDFVTIAAETETTSRELEEEDVSPEKDEETSDRLLVHLRSNMETIRTFCEDVLKQIPVPQQCVIEGRTTGASWRLILGINQLFTSK